MVIKCILKGRLDSKDRLTVTIRVTNGNVRKFKSTRIKVRADQFTNGKVVNHPQARHLNKILSKKLGEVKRLQDIPVDEDTLTSFYKYAWHCISLWSIKGTKKETTINQYLSKLRVLESWYPELDIEDIDKQWCENLHIKLITEKLNNNTIWNYFKTISLILNKAIDDDIIKRNEVKHYKEKPAYKDPNRAYLTKKQIIALEQYAAIASPNRRIATLWFLIGCYTGLRHSDMISFDKNKNIIDDRLVKELVKTRNMVSLPIRGKIKQLFEAVQWQPLRVQNRPYNLLLKKIAQDCGIEQNITCHTSRHSAGMMLAEAGVSIELTAAILGHTDTKHTRVYYHLTNKRVDEEIGRIID
ncbi:Site-specific recombinase XerD [Cnuella takakiae]|uniref:Site-specific recombinase XerD n=1 Tax=Cnuella takakiae TaxID=1302690 RepID=A0A1M5CE62_9BACT|nr:site-specific integrase [Cnuella takakiae]SHF52980.1 Site-specific recombinase XerD [Cnuella takakiae]